MSTSKPATAGTAPTMTSTQGPLIKLQVTAKRRNAATGALDEQLFQAEGFRCEAHGPGRGAIMLRSTDAILEVAPGAPAYEEIHIRTAAGQPVGSIASKSGQLHLTGACVPMAEFNLLKSP